MERYRRIVRAHVYDKCWQLDITWAEVEQLLDDDDVVEEIEDGEGRTKRVRLPRRLESAASRRRGGG